MTDSRQGGPPSNGDPDRTSKRSVRPQESTSPTVGVSDLLRNIPDLDLDSPRSDIETREVNVDPSLVERCAEAHEDVTEEIIIDPDLIAACRPDDPDGDPPDASIPDIIQQRLDAARTGQYVKLTPDEPVVRAVKRKPPPVAATPAAGVPRQVEVKKGISLTIVVVIGLIMLVLGLGVGGAVVFITFAGSFASPTATMEPTPEPAPLTPDSPLLSEPAPPPATKAPPRPNALVPAPEPAQPEPTAEAEEPEPHPAVAPPGPSIAELTELPDRLVIPVTFAPSGEEPATIDEEGIVRVAALITQTRGVRMELVGYSAESDGVSGVDAALLRRRRAEAVRDLLRSHGPSRRRFSMRGARDDETLAGVPGAAASAEARHVLLIPMR